MSNQSSNHTIGGPGVKHPPSPPPCTQGSARRQILTAGPPTPHVDDGMRAELTKSFVAYRTHRYNRLLDCDIDKATLAKKLLTVESEIKNPGPARTSTTETCSAVETEAQDANLPNEPTPAKTAAKESATSTKRTRRHNKHATELEARVITRGKGIRVELSDAAAPTATTAVTKKAHTSAKPKRPVKDATVRPLGVAVAAWETTPTPIDGVNVSVMNSAATSPVSDVLKEVLHMPPLPDAIAIHTVSSLGLRSSPGAAVSRARDNNPGTIFDSTAPKNNMPNTLSTRPRVNAQVESGLSLGFLPNPISTFSDVDSGTSIASDQFPVVGSTAVREEATAETVTMAPVHAALPLLHTEAEDSFTGCKGSAPTPLSCLLPRPRHSTTTTSITTASNWTNASPNNNNTLIVAVPALEDKCEGSTGGSSGSTTITAPAAAIPVMFFAPRLPQMERSPSSTTAGLTATTAYRLRILNDSSNTSEVRMALIGSALNPLDAAHPNVSSFCLHNAGPRGRRSRSEAIVASLASDAATAQGAGGGVGAVASLNVSPFFDGVMSQARYFSSSPSATAVTTASHTYASAESSFPDTNTTVTNSSYANKSSVTMSATTTTSTAASAHARAASPPPWSPPSTAAMAVASKKPLFASAASAASPPSPSAHGLALAAPASNGGEEDEKENRVRTPGHCNSPRRHRHQAHRRGCFSSEALRLPEAPKANNTAPTTMAAITTSGDTTKSDSAQTKSSARVYDVERNEDDDEGNNKPPSIPWMQSRTTWREVSAFPWPSSSSGSASSGSPVKRIATLPTPPPLSTTATSSLQCGELESEACHRNTVHRLACESPYFRTSPAGSTRSPSQLQQQPQCGDFIWGRTRHRDCPSNIPAAESSVSNPFHSQSTITAAAQSSTRINSPHSLLWGCMHCWSAEASVDVPLEEHSTATTTNASSLTRNTDSLCRTAENSLTANTSGTACSGLKYPRPTSPTFGPLNNFPLLRMGVAGRNGNAATGAAAPAAPPSSVGVIYPASTTNCALVRATSVGTLVSSTTRTTTTTTTTTITTKSEPAVAVVVMVPDANTSVLGGVPEMMSSGTAAAAGTRTVTTTAVSSATCSAMHVVVAHCSDGDSAGALFDDANGAAVSTAQIDVMLLDDPDAPPFAQAALRRVREQNGESNALNYSRQQQQRRNTNGHDGAGGRHEGGERNSTKEAMQSCCTVHYFMAEECYLNRSSAKTSSLRQPTPPQQYQQLQHSEPKQSQPTALVSLHGGQADLEQYLEKTLNPYKSVLNSREPEVRRRLNGGVAPLTAAEIHLPKATRMVKQH